MGKLRHGATKWPLHSTDPDSRAIYLSASVIASLKTPPTEARQSPLPSPFAGSSHNLIFHTWSAELSVQHQIIKETQTGILLMQKTFQKEREQK